MANRNIAVWILCVAACAAAAWLFSQNRALRREIAGMREERAAAEVQRPKMKDPPRSRPRRSDSPRPEERAMPEAPLPEDPAAWENHSEERLEEAVKGRIAEMRKQTEEARARRREAIAALTPEQKEEQREAFVSKMRERAQKRFNSFVSNTGLDDRQTAAFQSTVDALDTSLRETADSWAEYVRETGSFSRDEQMKFVGHVSILLSEGYDEMDETLTEDWREAEGDVNLMEIVGPEALSSMVEALTETGNEEGLQVIGQIMGGPGGDGGEAPSGLDGIESPGVGGGPGSMGDNGFGSDGPGGFSSDGPGL